MKLILTCTIIFFSFSSYYGQLAQIILGIPKDSPVLAKPHEGNFSMHLGLSYPYTPHDYGSKDRYNLSPIISFNYMEQNEKRGWGIQVSAFQANHRDTEMITFDGNSMGLNFLGKIYFELLPSSLMHLQPYLGLGFFAFQDAGHTRHFSGAGSNTSTTFEGDHYIMAGSTAGILLRHKLSKKIDIVYALDYMFGIALFQGIISLPQFSVGISRSFKITK